VRGRVRACILQTIPDCCYRSSEVSVVWRSTRRLHCTPNIVQVHHVDYIYISVYKCIQIYGSTVPVDHSHRQEQRSPMCVRDIIVALEIRNVYGTSWRRSAAHDRVTRTIGFFSSQVVKEVPVSKFDLYAAPCAGGHNCTVTWEIRLRIKSFKMCTAVLRSSRLHVYSAVPTYYYCGCSVK
jgi:hypothetical protein